MNSPLTPRQQRELDYHRAHAASLASRAAEPVALDIIVDAHRRPWNAYWSMYDRIIAMDVQGLRVLVPGCGFGDDAIRLALLGARVSAFDLSPDVLAIAEARAKRAGCTIEFAAMPSETLGYPDASFDLVLFVDILHHVDIAATMGEVARVLAPGGKIVGDELYTHTRLQRVRESAFVNGILYRSMSSWIYGGKTPYITEDEHKIDEAEFAIVTGVLDEWEADYFGFLEGRLFPNTWLAGSRIDRAMMRNAGTMKSVLGGRVVFTGRIG